MLLSNAAAVSWLDSRRILFSEVRTGIHMGIVTALEDRSEYREIYFPAHQRAMAHFSSPSPDRKWILVVEMGPDGGWEPCRLIPFDGTSAGRQAGPQGQCIAAAWSPNGRWMYFSAAVEGKHHLWRQRFPSGKPELITSSSTEEDGVAVTPDGRSLITSVGIRQGVLWIHDTAGERPLTKEGDVAPERAWPTPAALFSPDGESIYHLMRRDSPESPSALWRTNLRSGKSELVISGPSIDEYDVSSDGKEVIFAARNGKGVSELWLASMDRSSTPKRIGSSGEVSPRFGPEGQVVFQWSDGRANYLLSMNKDGSGRAKASDEPIGELFGVSPDRRIAVVGRASPDVHTAAVAIGGTVKRKICKGYCPVAWDPSGKFLYVGVQPNSSVATGKTAVIPIPAQSRCPNYRRMAWMALRAPARCTAFSSSTGMRSRPGLAQTCSHI